LRLAYHNLPGVYNILQSLVINKTEKEADMPVRKVSNRGGNAIGRFPSTKMGRMIAFESLLERDFIYLIDYDPAVEWFEEQPLSIEYLHEDQLLRYTPDFHLLEHGQHVLVECKPERFVETEENCRKFAVAREWCEERGWEFRIITDQQVRSGFRLQNVKRLAQYARQKMDGVICSQIFAFLQEAQSATSIHELALAILPTGSAVVTANIFCLAYRHEIGLPLDEAPISEATAVSRLSRMQKEGVQ
jgi:DNA-binding transcriptional LysR family regulator